MQVILLENIRNLGAFGSTVKVANGYGRNFLVPQGKAVAATQRNLERFQAQRSDLEAAAKGRLEEAKKRGEAVTAVGSISISARAADEGKLYGSIGTYDILHALHAAGLDVQKQAINLPNGMIREIGEYEIEIVLHSEVTVPLKVVVSAQRAGA